MRRSRGEHTRHRSRSNQLRPTAEHRLNKDDGRWAHSTYVRAIVTTSRRGGWHVCVRVRVRVLVCALFCACACVARSACARSRKWRGWLILTTASAPCWFREQSMHKPLEKSCMRLVQLSPDAILRCQVYNACADSDNWTTRALLT